MSGFDDRPENVLRGIDSNRRKSALKKKSSIGFVFTKDFTPLHRVGFHCFFYSSVEIPLFAPKYTNEEMEIFKARRSQKGILKGMPFRGRWVKKPGAKKKVS